MNYKILYPEKPGQKYYVIPSVGSGQCWGADTEEHANMILRFIKDNTPNWIENIRKIK